LLLFFTLLSTAIIFNSFYLGNFFSEPKFFWRIYNGYIFTVRYTLACFFAFLPLIVPIPSFHQFHRIDDLF
jgi:hypothetical protein